MAQNKDIEQRIEQLRARLQELDAQTSRASEETSRDASRKAREIVSRAEFEAASIRKNAQKEFAQVSRDACADAVRDKQQIQREVEALKQERKDLAAELNDLADRMKNVMAQGTTAPAAVQPEPAAPVPAAVQPKPETPAPAAVQPVQQPTAPIDQVLPAAAPPVAKTSEEQFKEALMEKPKKKRWKSVLITIIILILLGVLAFELLLGVTKMRDEGMEPGLSQGRRMLYSRISKQPHTNDLTVFENKAGLLCVRRAIARGGDTVDYNSTTNEILVNGKAIPNVPDDVEWWGVKETFEFPITVQEGEVFVLASNRDRATNEGLIKVDQVRGKVLQVF